ncbi:MAG: DUF480 domain-containing protein [Bryobacteraceae bacterium]|nr:DUF480 domain-containing protein [Bryobacteraceae bacterium]
MTFTLSSAECRALGVLIEKEMATPEYYPMSLNAVKNACNQKSNRDPVMELSEEEVETALSDLEDKKLAGGETGSRVVKYAHRLGEMFNLPGSQLALLGVLLLRGSQTAGELRARTQSLHAFEDSASVELALGKLAEREMAVQLPRQPGSREPRWMHVLSGPVDAAMLAATARHEEPARSGLAERVEKLEIEVAELRSQLLEIREATLDRLERG